MSDVFKDVSPLVVVLLSFYAVIALLCVGVLIWTVEHLKRMRLLDAVKQLQTILTLATDALKHRSPQECDKVNTLIDSWDKSFSREVGTEIQKLDGV